ncbi:hypothetical protein BH20VER1_BH20VER1_09200 [soil metagenome]
MRLLALSTSLLLAGALVLSGCASKAESQQRAYQKYIKQASTARAKQSAKIRQASAKIPDVPPGEPIETVEMSSPDPDE